VLRVAAVAKSEAPGAFVEAEATVVIVEDAFVAVAASSVDVEGLAVSLDASTRLSRVAAVGCTPDADEAPDELCASECEVEIRSFDCDWP
jgi:hypothetical protein